MQQQIVTPLRETKFAEAGGAMLVEGYGSVFGNVDSYGDVVAPGAFAATLAQVKAGNFPWPSMMLEHGEETKVAIGSWLEFSEDGYGLKVRGKIADTTAGLDAYKLLTLQPRPAITGLSIGFVPKEVVPRSRADEPRRVLKAVDLYEVSLVTFPANTKALVTDVKSAIAGAKDFRDVERILRDAGFSRSDAVALVSQVKAIANGQGDPGPNVAQLATSLEAMLARFPHRPN